MDDQPPVAGPAYVELDHVGAKIGRVLERGAGVLGGHSRPRDARRSPSRRRGRARKGARKPSRFRGHGSSMPVARPSWRDGGGGVAGARSPTCSQTRDKDDLQLTRVHSRSRHRIGYAFAPGFHK